MITFFSILALRRVVCLWLFFPVNEIKYTLHNASKHSLISSGKIVHLTIIYKTFWTKNRAID